MGIAVKKRQYIRFENGHGRICPERINMYILEFIGYCGDVVAKETISAESYDKARQMAANRLYECPEMWGVNVLLSDRK